MEHFIFYVYQLHYSYNYFIFDSNFRITNLDISWLWAEYFYQQNVISKIKDDEIVRKAHTAAQAQNKSMPFMVES